MQSLTKKKSPTSPPFCRADLMCRSDSQLRHCSTGKPLFSIKSGTFFSPPKPTHHEICRQSAYYIRLTPRTSGVEIGASQLARLWPRQPIWANPAITDPILVLCPHGPHPRHPRDPFLLSRVCHGSGKPAAPAAASHRTAPGRRSPVEQSLVSSAKGTMGRECVQSEGGFPRGDKGWMAGWVRVDGEWGGSE